MHQTFWLSFLSLTELVIMHITQWWGQQALEFSTVCSLFSFSPTFTRWFLSRPSQDIQPTLILYKDLSCKGCQEGGAPLSPLSVRVLNWSQPIHHNPNQFLTSQTNLNQIQSKAIQSILMLIKFSGQICCPPILFHTYPSHFFCDTLETFLAIIFFFDRIGDNAHHPMMRATSPGLFNSLLFVVL